MLARAKALDSRCSFIDGGTFHATATKIINQNIHVFGMDRPFTILDPEDATQIVTKVIEPIKADDNRNWPRASTVAKAISFDANTSLPIGQAIDRNCPDYPDFHDRSEKRRVRQEWNSKGRT